MGKRRYYFYLFLIVQISYASDAITVDSIFKQNEGLRSITTINFISANNTRVFSSYPVTSSLDDGSSISETQKLSLNETLLYSYNPETDILISGNYSSDKTTYIGENDTYHKTSNNIDSLWIGLSYSLETIFEQFKPSLSFQTAVVQNNQYQSTESTESFKNFYLKYSMRNYSDPLISTISFSSTQNLKYTIAEKEINPSDSYSISLDISLILNPKISLNMGFNNTYQTSLRENSYVINDSTILSDMGFGVSYIINEKNSFTFNSQIGTSANTPNSITSFSLWHKF